jgi:hypothetical protein
VIIVRRGLSRLRSSGDDRERRAVRAECCGLVDAALLIPDGNSVTLELDAEVEVVRGHHAAGCAPQSRYVVEDREPQARVEIEGGAHTANVRAGAGCGNDIGDDPTSPRRDDGPARISLYTFTPKT